MSGNERPKHYEKLKQNFPDCIQAVEALGQAVQKAGPLDARTLLLIQLGAAAAMRSEGSVRSHARRAMAEGATQAEINHALLGLTSTIGFPTVAAALSWVDPAGE